MGAGKFAPKPFARRGALRPSGGDSDRDSARLEQDLTARLRQLAPPPAPAPDFKADLRFQLASITARVVAESAAEEPAGRAATSPTPRGVASGLLRRPILAFTGASTVLVVVLGLMVWLSGGSLPGQSLYRVKRANENVQLSMAGGDAAKGRTYLSLAANRIHEATDLLGKPDALAWAAPSRLGRSPGTAVVLAAGGAVSAHTLALVNDTLANADTDTRNGMQLLGRAAVSQVSAGPLATLIAWSPAQQADLTVLRTRAPASALRDRVQASLDVLARVEARATALKAEMGCPCLSLAVADSLGPLPCGPCSSVAAPGATGTATAPNLSGLPSSAVPPGSTAVAGTQPGSSARSDSSSTGGNRSGDSGGSSAGTAGSPGGASSGGTAPSSGTGSSSGNGGSGGDGSSGGTAGGPSSPGTTSAPGSLLPLPTSVPPVLPSGLPLPSVSIGTGGTGVSVPGVSIGIGPSGVSASLLPLPGITVPGGKEPN